MFKNIFKNTKATKPKTVLCIPGNWKSRDEIVTAIAENNDGNYLFAGKVLLDVKNNISYEIEIEEHNEDLRNSFYWAGMVNQLSEVFLDEIDQHQFTVYIIGETGGFESSQNIAKVGNAVLKAGGIGLKVESAGKAFTKEHWSELVNDYTIVNMYEMFVLDCIQGNNGDVYSCGMHHLGYKDTIVYNEDVSAAVDLVVDFSFSQLIDDAVFKSNQDFQTNDDEPKFTVTEELHQPNAGDELFENQYGMWKLQRKL